MMKLNSKTGGRAIFVIIVLALIACIFKPPLMKSGYTQEQAPAMVPTPKRKPVNASKGPAPPQKPKANGIVGMDIDASDLNYATVESLPTMNREVACALNSGTGLASSLLPREVAKTQNFGEFSADDILKGQSFLDPRSQIGFPETIGGNLRNANQSIRAEPPNPKQVFVWQNSTIVPDIMQRKLV